MARALRSTESPHLPLGLRLLVAVLFAASGAGALIDQVVWTRWLNLSLGSSSYAAIVVLATFMGGLGVGSWLSGPLADRRPRQALLLFASAEAGIGLWSLFSIPLLSRWLPRLAAGLGSGPDDPTLALPLRAGLAAAALAVPTVLMGATLPFLARWVVSAGGRAGRDVGLFYTLNTLGGAAGTLYAAFWLIETLGLSRSVAVAGATDLGVALVAALLAGRMQGLASTAKSKERANDSEEKDETRRAPLFAAAGAFFISGLVGLALEVVSHRVLAVLAGSSAYAFSVMLAAFLVGIALGSLAGSRLAEQARSPGVWLAMGLAALAFGIGLARRVFEGATFHSLGGGLAELMGQDLSSWTALLASCWLALLPAAVALGFVVPFVARLAAHAPRRLARRFGIAYALNTLGAVLGTLLAGTLLVPRLGSATTFTLLVLIAGMGSIAVLFATVAKKERRFGLVAALLLILAGIGLGWGTDPVRHTLLSHFAGHTLRAYREGAVQTIAVIEESNLQQLDFLRLVTNQTSLTGTHLYAQRYMKLLGHLPVLYTPHPRRALVICLGTGMTAAAVATHPEVERLDIAEISPEVVAVAPQFRELTDAVLEDPRTHLTIDDGRQVLLASSERWDLITLEPPPPRDSGVVSLYTTEFYRLAEQRLNRGGVLAQWIPLHSQSGEEIRMLIRSFLDGFPHVLAFLPVERDLILLGSSDTLEMSPERIGAALAHSRVRNSLHAIGLDDPAELYATALFGRKQLEVIAGSAPAVTDDRPRVEYFHRFGRHPPLPALGEWMHDLLPLTNLAGKAQDPPLRSAFARARRALLLLLRGAWASELGQGAQGAALRLSALREEASNPYLLWAAGLSDAHLERLRQRAQRPKLRAEALRELGLRLSQLGRVDEAIRTYRQALDAAPRNAETLLQLGDLLMGAGQQPSEGRALLEAVLRLAPHHPAAPLIRRRLGIH